MRMRSSELQDDDKEGKKFWLKGLLKDWEDFEEVLYSKAFYINQKSFVLNW